MIKARVLLATSLLIALVASSLDVLYEYENGIKPKPKPKAKPKP